MKEARIVTPSRLQAVGLGVAALAAFGLAFAAPRVIANTAPTQVNTADAPAVLNLSSVDLGSYGTGDAAALDWAAPDGCHMKLAGAGPLSVKSLTGDDGQLGSIPKVASLWTADDAVAKDGTTCADVPTVKNPYTQSLIYTVGAAKQASDAASPASTQAAASSGDTSGTQTETSASTSTSGSAGSAGSGGWTETKTSATFTGAAASASASDDAASQAGNGKPGNQSSHNAVAGKSGKVNPGQAKKAASPAASDSASPSPSDSASASSSPSATGADGDAAPQVGFQIKVKADKIKSGEQPDEVARVLSFVAGAAEADAHGGLQWEVRATYTDGTSKLQGFSGSARKLVTVPIPAGQGVTVKVESSKDDTDQAAALFWTGATLASPADATNSPSATASGTNEAAALGATETSPMPSYSDSGSGTATPSGVESSGVNRQALARAVGSLGAPAAPIPGIVTKPAGEKPDDTWWKDDGYLVEKYAFSGKTPCNGNALSKGNTQQMSTDDAVSYLTCLWGTSTRTWAERDCDRSGCHNINHTVQGALGEKSNSRPDNVAADDFGERVSTAAPTLPAGVAGTVPIFDPSQNNNSLWFVIRVTSSFDDANGFAEPGNGRIQQPDGSSKQDSNGGAFYLYDFGVSQSNLSCFDVDMKASLTSDALSRVNVTTKTQDDTDNPLIPAGTTMLKIGTVTITNYPGGQSRTDNQGIDDGHDLFCIGSVKF